MRRLYLPPTTNRKAVGAALKMHHDAADVEHIQRWRGWTWVHRWLNGVRSETLSLAGAPQGIPSPTYKNQQGRRRIRFEKALGATQTEVGRVLHIDTAPAVERRCGVGLNGLREESISQALCDAVYRDAQAAGVVHTAAFMTVAYGLVGLYVASSELPGREWMPVVSIVPPWEMRPLPAGPLGLHDVAGIEWCRWVPYKWLKRQYSGHGLKFPSGSVDSVAEKLRMRKEAKGTVINDEGAPPPLTGAYATYSGSQEIATEGDRRPNEDEDVEYYVQLREYFLGGDGDTMVRQIAMLGEDWVAADVDFLGEAWQERLDGTLPVMPIHIGGYQEAPSFYPRSFVDRQLPISRELEYLIGDLIRNQLNMDRLRKLMVPNSGGANIRAFRASANDSVCGFTPDWVSPNAQPFMVEPGNISEQHGPTLNILGAMLNDLSQQGPLFQGRMPNRADSAVAAMAVSEFQDVPLTGCAELLEHMWAGAFRASIFHARTHLNSTLNQNAPQEALIELGRIDETVLGVQFDQETGRVDLCKYTLPDPHYQKLTIRNKNPRPKQALYEDLKERRAGGLITQAEFDIAIAKFGLEVPTVSRAAVNNYERAWMENVLMFGDGKTPGTIRFEEFGDNHSIHYMVHMEVIGSAAFQAAEEAVRTKIISHVREHHLPALGGWPAALATPDMLARPVEQRAPTAALGMPVPGMANLTE